MISIVDYGIGNIQAFLNLFSRLGISVKRACTAEDLKGSNHLVLPGVGHFDHAMKSLNKSGMKKPLEELVLGLKIPVLGVCVGMQMLSNGSDEGSIKGLGWVPGRVRAFKKNPQTLPLPLPHMGWNTLSSKNSDFIFKNDFKESSQFYFLHSYYFDAEDKADVSATCYYGFNFDAAVSRKNIHGVQFHPEKSHKWGEQLLKNFIEL